MCKKSFAQKFGLKRKDKSSLGDKKLRQIIENQIATEVRLKQVRRRGPFITISPDLPAVCQRILGVILKFGTEEGASLQEISDESGFSKDLVVNVIQYEGYRIEMFRGEDGSIKYRLNE